MELPESVRITYLKSPGYRAIHVDGALGGPTPDLNIYLALWSQRGAIPDATVHSISADGRFDAHAKEVIARSSGMIREVECGVMMSIEAAKSLHEWLGEKLSETEELKKASQQDAGITK